MQHREATEYEIATYGMTPEKAIGFLEIWKYDKRCGFDWMDRKAIDTAISALRGDYKPKWNVIATEADLPTETGEYEVTMHTPSGLYVTIRNFYGYWHGISDEERRLRRFRQEHWLPAPKTGTQWIIAWREKCEPYQAGTPQTDQEEK
jgi:hypothetical protein